MLKAKQMGIFGLSLFMFSAAQAVEFDLKMNLKDTSQENPVTTLHESTIDLAFGESKEIVIENEAKGSFVVDIGCEKAEDAENAVLCHCSIYKSEGESRTLLAEPEFVAQMNEESSISLGDNSEELSLSLLAH